MKIHTFAVGLITAAMAAQVVPGKVWGVEVPALAAGGNAAETYQRAFELVQQSGTGKSPVMQADVRTVAVDEKVKGVLEANKEAVGLVKKGAGEAGCDWGELPGEMQKVLDALNGARTVDSLMVLQAREDLKEGRAGEAVGDWLAAVAMERRVGEIRLVVASLVSDATEGRMIEEIARALPGLPGEARRKLEEGWGKLPAGVTGSEMIMGEYEYAKVAGAKQNVGGWVEALKPFYTSLAGAAGGRPAAFDRAVDEQMGKFKLNPFAQTIGPALKRTREPMAVVEAKRAMLGTAMAVVEKGKGEVGKSKDPFGEGAFKYKEVEGGFELESGLVVNGKAVRLRVGGH